MHSRRIPALLGAIAVVMALVGAAPAATPSTVTIRIEGSKKTLLLSTSATGEMGSITQGGTPTGKCSGATVAGALDRVTHHNWTGKYYASVPGIFVTSILGEKPAGNDYWALFVNNKSSTKGICDLTLYGEQVLFADSDGSHYPAALTTPQSATAGHPFTVQLVGYNAKGKAKPLAGVSITGGGIPAVKTNAHGAASITDSHHGNLVLRAAPTGYLRTEALVHVAG